MSARSGCRITVSLFLTAACTLCLPSLSYAVPGFGLTCGNSGCHGTPSLATTPGDGGTLSFGNTLVSQSSNAAFIIRNITQNTPFGGGFGGNFPVPGAGTPFTLNGAVAITGDSNLTVGGYLTPQEASESRTYTYTPTGRGSSSTILSFTPINGYTSPAVPPTVSITLQGQGVAPVINVDSRGANAGNVRLGTGGHPQFTVNNVGDGNLSGQGAISNLNGNVPAVQGVFVGAGGNFSLPDSGAQTFSYSFTPTSRGPASSNFSVSTTNGSVDGTNHLQSLPVTLSGNGVGPLFSSSVPFGSTVSFGDVVGPSSSQLLTLSNATLDDDLGALTRLTLLNSEITGPDAEMFSLLNFTPGTGLNKNNVFDLQIGFTSSGKPGLYSASLSLLTDQGTALGDPGMSFSYTLTANAVPEPETLALLSIGLGWLGLVILRRRRYPSSGVLALPSQA